jgi:hypothetical protein
MGFEGDKAQGWNKFTTLAMNTIHEDERDDIDVLSMVDLLALTDILSAEMCYPSALCTAFHSYFACGNTTRSMEKRTQRAMAMKAITEAQQAPLTGKKQAWQNV